MRQLFPRPARRTATRGTAAVAAVASVLVSSFVPAQAQAPDMATLSAYAAGGSSSPLDSLGRPTPETAAKVRAFANQPFVPADARNAMLSALAFSAGEGASGGPALVEGQGPNFTQFYWPTVSGRCIGGTLDSVGSGIAIPGPTTIPAPGAGEGETVFLFTALGTAAAAPDQGEMRVQWFNLDTHAFGNTPLFNNGINPEGPATVSGRAKTGKGTVVAVMAGTVKSVESNCNFVPIAAIIEVR